MFSITKCSGINKIAPVLIMETLFKNISETVELSKEEKEYFSSLVQLKEYKKKAFLLRAGEVCRNQSFVTKGCLKIFYVDHEGVEHVAKFAPEDWWAFDIESFLMQRRAFFNIQAIEDTEALLLSRERFDQLLEQVPRLEKYYRTLFQNSYIMLQHRLTQNLYAKAEEKYQRFTEKYPGLEQRIPQKDIAAYLGITPEFLSMLRRRRMTGVV